MASSIPQFWKLAADSRLLKPEQCQQLDAQFQQVRGADRGNAEVLAEWLIAQQTISRFQATVLLAGHAGPFLYGDYKVYDCIDSGRMAGIFRGFHVPTGHPVWLQFCSGTVTQHPQQWTALAQRVRTQSGIVHPHLHRCYEPVDLTAFKFLVFEDLDGQCLEELLVSTPLTSSEACNAVRMAAAGLLHLHQLGQVHADVRPWNLWRGKRGYVKLLLDPARPSEPNHLSQGRCPTSSPADYLAPEFSRAGKMPDVLTDIYALGCTLYHLLAGRPPFAGGNRAEKMHRHANESIQPLEQFGAPPSLGQLVAYMMAKNPSVRYQHLAAVIQQLTPFIEPAELHLKPPSLPATLPAYENYLQQRSALSSEVSASLAEPAAAATPPPTRPDPSPVTVVDRGAEAPGGAAIVSPTAASSAAARLRSKPAASKTVMLASAGALLAIVALILVVVAYNQAVDGRQAESDQSLSRQVPSVTEGTKQGEAHTTTSSDTPSGGLPDVRAPGLELIDDDGHSLWASPTNAAPLELQYLPLGSLTFLSVRPAEILALEEGQRVIRALGPHFASLRDSWEQAAGVRLEEIEQLVIGMHDNGDDFPRPSFVVRLNHAVARQQLLARWGDVAPLDQAGYYRGEAWSFYLPATSDRVFVMGSAEEMQDVASRGGTPPPPRSGIGSLLKSSDADRHFTILLVPHDIGSNFLRDGHRLFFGEPRKLRDPLDWFLGDDLRAVMLSMHFGDQFYVEMRFASQLSRDKYTLAVELQDRLQEIPDRVETYLAEQLAATPYWRRVAMRFPAMIRFLHAQTRVQVEGDQAVINALLPGIASHNLVFGSEMLLSSQSNKTPLGHAAPKPSGPNTIEQLLSERMSLVFDQTSLEFAARDIETDIKERFTGLPFEFAVKIIGEDLKLNGITRNQQISDFDQTDKKVEEILTALVMRANPITTVTDPSELDQKLIWVIGPDPQNERKRIVLITTRDAAQAKNYRLPAVFQVKATSLPSEEIP